MRIREMMEIPMLHKVRKLLCQNRREKDWRGSAHQIAILGSSLTITSMLTRHYLTPHQK
jgi:hypothetical protein